MSVDALEPSGTITGMVVDKSTSKPLAGVEVTLGYANPDSSDQDKFIRTTDNSGRFVFDDIPVNNSGGNFAFNMEDEEVDLSMGSSSNFSYSLTLDMSDHEGYREFTVFDDIRLNFESGGMIGGTGSAEKLVSSVVLPVGKLNASVKGQVLTNSTNEAVEGAKVEVYLADGYEGFKSAEDILINSGTTDSKGSFKIDGLDESSDIYLRIVKEIDDKKRINVKTDEYELLASAQSESPLLDIGNIFITPINSASNFYVTNISVEDGSLLDPNDVEFIFDFNKPVRQTPYTSTAHNFGVNSGTLIDDFSLVDEGTRAKIGNEYELSLAWNETYDQLVVTVTENLPDGYHFKLDATNALFNLADEDESSLFFSSETPYSSFYEAGIINFATNGNTKTPAVPKLFAEYDSEVDYNGVPVDLISVVDESEVDVAYVEIYRKVGNENFTRVEKVAEWFSDQIVYKTSTGFLVKARSGGKNYDSTVEVSYKVRAVSINLKRSDFSETIVIKDVMGPKVEYAEYTTEEAPAGRAYLDIWFNEPMKTSSSGSEVFNAENYFFRDLNEETKPVTFVDVKTYYYDTNKVRLEITRDALKSGDKVVVDSNVTDLAGNGLSKDGTDDEAEIIFP